MVCCQRGVHKQILISINGLRMKNFKGEIYEDIEQLAVGTRPGTFQLTLGGVNRNLVIAKYIGDSFRGHKESLSAFVNRVAEVLGVARITRKRKSTFASSTKEKRTRTESGKEMIDRHKIKDKYQGIHTVNIPNVKIGS